MSSNPWNAFRSANKGKGWSPQKMTEEYQAWKASGAPLATSGSSHDVRREPRSNEPDGPPSSVAKPRTRAQTGANTSGSKDEKPLVLPAHDRKESVENAPLRSNAQQQSGNYRFLAAIRDDDEQPPQTSQFQTPSSVGVQERPHSRGFPDSPPATHDKQYATSSPRVTPSGLSAPQSPPVAGSMCERCIAFVVFGHQ